MKAKLRLIPAILLVFFLTTASSHAATLNLDDWQFNPQGAISSLDYGLFYPIDEINILGTSLINSTGGNSFKQFGTFEATSFSNNGAVISPMDTGLGMISGPDTGYELTFVLSDTTGAFNATGDPNVNDISFATASLDIYLDSADTYGTDAGTYGATDGVKVASFELSHGTGSIDWGASGNPDGSTDLVFKSTFLLAGVWFDKDHVDLSTYEDKDLLVLGMTDSNNEVLNEDDTSTLWTEYDDVAGFDPGNIDGMDRSKFFVRSDGSFDLAATPEPGTVFLLGLGLFGLAFAGRKARK